MHDTTNENDKNMLRRVIVVSSHVVEVKEKGNVDGTG